jgi:hypothetical protein
MEVETNSPLLDTAQAACYLRLRPATLERWRSIGEGPPFSKLGRRVVYFESDLEEFARSRRRDSTDEDS